MNELQRFEKATGITFTPEFLKSQTNECVDIRDIFVSLIIKEGSRKEFERIGEMVGKDRTSVYAMKERFENRLKNDSNYKMKYKTLKEMYTKQLELF